MDNDDVVGIVQQLSVARYPLANSAGVDWVKTVNVGDKLYTSSGAATNDKLEEIAQYFEGDGYTLLISGFEVADVIRKFKKDQ